MPKIDYRLDAPLLGLLEVLGLGLAGKKDPPLSVKTRDRATLIRFEPIGREGLVLGLVGSRGFACPEPKHNDQA